MSRMTRAGVAFRIIMLIFLHSLHLSALLNLLISVNSSTLHRFLRAGVVSLTFVFLMFIFYFIFIFIFPGRLLVRYFSLVAPAICHCSSCTLCCMCSWQINDDDDDDEMRQMSWERT